MRAFSLSSFELFCVLRDFNGLNRSHLVNYLAHLINFEHFSPPRCRRKNPSKGLKTLSAATSSRFLFMRRSEFGIAFFS